MLAGTKEANFQRITLITDESLEKLVLDQAVRLGVDSYICSFCSGRPLRAAIEFQTDGRSLVRIELLAQATQARDILAYIQQLQQRNYPVMAVIDPVTALT
jgi:hypothetical protein